MKFTLSWLKEHLETSASLEEILEGLTMIGLEVEHVDDRKVYAPFVIARVLEASQHPDADRLRVLSVDIGADKPLQVVCGAPNARAGLVGVLARPGDYVPGLDVTLSVGKIRGVESFGMMASERELLLSEEHDGIIDLPQDAPVGTSFAAYAHLDDPVIEIAITPNRGDCLGVHGVARDLAALGIGTLKDAPLPAIRGEGSCPVSVTLDFPEGDRFCPAFGLRLVRGVKNGASPDWLQRRLRAIGLRPINALVDITNYITFDRGRPLHVFDAAKVAGNLTVRYAREGETLLALDGKSYTLDAGMGVIADDRGPESLAGIMGGEESGCDENTTDVLIESALWDANAIARTGRKLGINSDARYRFERGVDPAQMLPGLERATRMVMELCGGTPSESLIAGSPDIEDRVIDFPYSEIRRLSGIVISNGEAKRILTRLGFWVVDHGDNAKVAVPSWRPDVEAKADLVEEVMRIVGVDKVPLESSLGRNTVVRPVLTTIQRRTRHAKRTLAGRGLIEAVTWSFVSQEQAEAFGGGSRDLVLANPIASDLSHMRPSLLPGLLSAAQRNVDRGFADVALFEVGQIFANDTPEGQAISACGIRRGSAVMAGAGRHWAGSMPPVSLYDVKADVLTLLGELGLDPETCQITRDAPSWYHPGRSGSVRRGRDVFAHFGELHPGLLESLDLDGPIVAFEVTLDAIPEPKKKATKAKPPLALSGLMPVRRDFAFLVRKSVDADKLVKAARGADRQLITDVTLFDRYAGDRLGADEVSLAIEVTLQPREKTLTDEDFEAVSRKIVDAVTKATGATLRG